MMNKPKPMTRPAAELAPADMPRPEVGSPEWLSAWMDGEGGEDDAVTLWRSDASLRTAWADYHCIGDALRSDDLCGRTDDARFLACWRERVAHEPIMLAPQADLAQRAAGAKHASVGVSGRWAGRWIAPAGIAAGVMMVASSLWMWQRPAASVETTLAAGSTAPSAAISPGTRPAVSASTWVVDRPTDLRSGTLQAVEFEPYLAAHKQFQPANAQGSASGFLRSAVYESR